LEGLRLFIALLTSEIVTVRKKYEVTESEEVMFGEVILKIDLK
jgi:hypothetical protein